MGEDVVTVPMEESAYRVPKSIIEAVSDIQQYAVMESEGATDIPENFLTFRRYFGYVNLGFLYGLGDNAIVWLIAPFLYAILFNVFPIFGHKIPTLWDKIFVFILSKYTTIALIALMGFVMSKIKGTITRGCAGGMVSGYCVSLVLRAIIFLFVYRWLYMVWPKICGWIASVSARMHGPMAFKIYRLSAFLWQRRHLLLVTSNYETLFALLELGVVVGMWFYFTRWRASKISNPYYGRF